MWTNGGFIINVSMKLSSDGSREKCRKSIAKRRHCSPALEATCVYDRKQIIGQLIGEEVAASSFSCLLVGDGSVLHRDLHYNFQLNNGDAPGCRLGS